MKTLHLYAAPAAVTQDSVQVYWDKPEWHNETAGYAVFKNGVMESLYTRTNCTLEKLAPDTEYTVSVKAVFIDGSFSDSSNEIIVKTKPLPKVFDITAFGAIADGKTLNTSAIQAAIDACTPGGMVYVPKGLFITGAVFLKSDMTLYLDTGAILKGSENLEDYPVFPYNFEGQHQNCYASLIQTPKGEKNLRNITIAGKGTLDASGTVLRAKMEKEGAGKRGRTVYLSNVDGVYLKDITIRHSPAWCTHIIYSKNITLNGVTINSAYNEFGEPYHGIHNGDGLDPDACSHVRVFNCTITSQDDCIAIKSGKNEEGRAVGIASEDILISNCRFLSGFGICCGSEMSGCVRDVLVQDCTFENTFSIASIKTMRGRGAVIERVTYDNCTLRQRNYNYHESIWYRGALYLDAFYGGPNDRVNEPMPVNEGTPEIRDITFKNLLLDTVSGNAVYLSGLPEMHAKNIRLENIKALGDHAMIVHHVDGLTMENVQIFGRDGSRA